MSHIEIKLARPRVDEVFARYKHLIGKDFPGYRNYVYRALLMPCIFWTMNLSMRP